MPDADALLGERYLLLSLIAAGGMGEVWRARDSLLGREVAVKVLRAHVAVDPSFRSRFRNEARITAGLSDHGIAQVFDYGEQDQIAYLVMELVQGEPLSAIMDRNGALGPDVTLDVLQQSARALQAAHTANVIHRDIKPGNLMVTPEGVIKVTDFGIARALEAAPLTQAGTVLGTARYISPEQAQGDPLTPATDLYSLGVVAYESLTGRPPFKGDSSVAVALQHINATPPPLPEHVPAPVRDLVMSLLAKDPALRPTSALALADRARALRASLSTGGRGADLGMLTDPAGFSVAGPATVMQADIGQAATPPTDIGQIRKDRVRRATLLLVTAGCAVLLILGSFALSQVGQSTPTVTEPTMTAPASPSVTPSRAPTRKPVRTPAPAVPVKTERPLPSPSATVSTTAVPTMSPTPEPTPTTPTPSPTPTPSQTPTPTPTPTSPDPGETDPSNPPNEET